MAGDDRLDGLGTAIGAAGRPAQAARLMGAAETLYGDSVARLNW